MNARTLRPSVLSLFAALCFAAPAFCQESPDISGYVSPANAYHTDNIDYVDMKTGRLAFDIPLVEDHSQRGKLNFTYSLRYGSGALWTTFTNGQYSPAGGLMGPIPGPYFSMDGHLVLQSEEYLWYCDQDNNCYYKTVNFAIDDQGAQHDLGSVGTTMESVDGSGILGTGAVAGAVVDRQGIQYARYFGGTYPYQDLGENITGPNGNQINFMTHCQYGSGCGPKTMTDTVGRTWTTTTWSSNVSGCPVAAGHATIWDTPGYNGGVREFKFCYTDISICHQLPQH